MSDPKFRIDQLVGFVRKDLRLTSVGQFKVAGDHPLRSLEQFRIVRLLPVEHGIRQYRIKSVKDGHERVVMESELE